MSKRCAAVLLVIVVVAQLVGAGTSSAAVAPTISGPAWVVKSATVSISGRAQPRQAVQIWFHRAGEPAGHYALRRQLTADSAGGYGTRYVADTDYRYYARAGGRNSATVLTQLRSVSISGPGSIGLGGTVRITGVTRPAGAPVLVYFHRAGEPPGHYSLRRHLSTDARGRWSTSYVANADYRYYATAGGATSVIVLTRIAQPWLAVTNSYRSAFGVPAVQENPALSKADALHVRYMYSTGVLGHSEDPRSPYYTAAGNTAASRSNVASGGGDIGDVVWINLWMNGPFHEIGVLRPTLQTVGFASGTGRYGTYAALDVLSDARGPDPGHWPKSFPSARAAFPFRTYSKNEIPNPIFGCSQTLQKGVVSAPLLVSLGPAAAAVASASARLTNDTTGQSRTLCVVTESTYKFSDPNWQDAGRSILRENHSIVVFAAGSLAGSSHYTLTVTPNGRRATTVHFGTTR